MRVSSQTDDVGYEAYQNVVARGCQIKVTLNDYEVKDCYTADDEAGYVFKAVRPLSVEGGNIVTETLYGDVKIIEVQLKGNK
jgi:hypothetical protein